MATDLDYADRAVEDSLPLWPYLVVALVVLATVAAFVVQLAYLSGDVPALLVVPAVSTAGVTGAIRRGVASIPDAIAWFVPKLAGGLVAVVAVLYALGTPFDVGVLLASAATVAVVLVGAGIGTGCYRLAAGRLS